MYCFTCGDERAFEQPPCEDGHGEECPERVCVDCGSAVLVGLTGQVGQVGLTEQVGLAGLVGPPPAVTAPAPRRAPETARASTRAATARAVA